MSGSVIGSIVFGVLLTAVAFSHPIGPGLMLAAETPFDAIPFVIFGVLGNLITYVPIVILLMKVNSARWGELFLGTRIQQLIGFFVMAMLVSHALSIVERGLGEIFEWLRKVTLFLLVGVFAYSMRQTKYLPLLVKTMVASMALLTFLAMLDFYLGIQVLPVKSGRLESAALDVEFNPYLATVWRFSGPGYPVNRFSNYLLLSIFLGFGWFMYVKNPFQRLVALGCTMVLVLGELFTVTRSGILGMGVGFLVMLPMALRLKWQSVFGLLIFGGLFAVAITYGAALTSADQVLSQRFDFEHVVHSTQGRLERVFAALQIWARHPLLGVGWGAFSDYSREYIKGGGKGAHNGYLNVLAEAGLVGFVPLMVLTVAVVRRNFVRVGHLSEELEFWRPYFFCGLLAQFVTNVFNDYLWERYLWVNFAFVVVLEQCYQAERAKRAQARFEEMRVGSEQGVEFATARANSP